MSKVAKKPKSVKVRKSLAAPRGPQATEFVPATSLKDSPELYAAVVTSEDGTQRINSVSDMAGAFAYCNTYNRTAGGEAAQVVHVEYSVQLPDGD